MVNETNTHIESTASHTAKSLLNSVSIDRAGKSIIKQIGIYIGIFICFDRQTEPLSFLKRRARYGKTNFCKGIIHPRGFISAADMPIYGICFALLNCGRSVCL